MLHGWSQRKSSVLAFGTVAATPSDACTLRLTHRARGSHRAAFGKAVAPRAAGAPSGGNESKFKLITVVLPPFSLNAGNDKDFMSARGFMDS